MSIRGLIGVLLRLKCGNSALFVQFPSPLVSQVHYSSGGLVTQQTKSAWACSPPSPPLAVTAMFVCSLHCHSDLLIANLLLQRRRLTVLLLFVIWRSEQAVWSICRNHRTPLKGSVVLFDLFETNYSSCGYCSFVLNNKWAYYYTARDYLIPTVLLRRLTYMTWFSNL